ncbi:chemotaxis protein CheW [Desulforamulus ruminis]|uniref:CheW domain protein n=1 Tax=Desulforamulus ruminis (strain ATCC 23193 / DSM 2154 / NCIMB 8452 / DL) TaxID=696281 RepID=F6DV33_DESRL|nr:chemotaxis protein CheW [Desulforamulus ruminis]AEG59099.1 CheW domain protein [Desulforamulus ruminis DSM 2154]
MAKQIVVFTMGKQHYAIPMEEVLEIIRLVKITPIPKASRWIKGVISLRSAIIPVLDLAPVLGRATENVNAKQRIMVVKAGDHTAGIIVDAVEEVTFYDPEQLEFPAYLPLLENERLVQGIFKYRDALGLLINLSALVQLDH